MYASFLWWAVTSRCTRARSGRTAPDEKWPWCPRFMACHERKISMMPKLRSHYAYHRQKSEVPRKHIKYAYWCAWTVCSFLLSVQRRITKRSNVLFALLSLITYYTPSKLTIVGVLAQTYCLHLFKTASTIKLSAC